MAALMQPEFFLLLGIDLFLVISLLSCLLDKHFPWQLPYLYQTAALAGFGQLIVSKEFMTMFGDYMRFWFSFVYLIVALGNIVVVNIYLGFIKKLFNYAKVFMFTVSFPSLAIVAFFLVNYASVAPHSILMFPQVSWQTTFTGIVAFDASVIGFGICIFFKPKRWYLVLGADAAITGTTLCAFYTASCGATVFVISAIALASACVLILTTSLYNLVRTWRENLEKIHMEVKKAK